MLLHAARLLTPDGLAGPGWVATAGPLIEACGTGEPPSVPDAELDGLVSPGFVDVHSHGGGGAAFGADVDAARTVLATHLACGTTTMVASLVTGALDDMARAVTVLAGLVRAGELAGVHLEGPWLAPEYKGAHEAALLRDPVPTDLARLVDAGAGAVRLVTIAPERPGAMEAISYLAGRGVVVAVGHTASDEATARAAVARGATGATHLFNAMPDLLHRAPGPALALWSTPGVWLELIADGVHVAPGLVAHVMATAPDRCVLVTDAMAAAGAGDGDYSLGGLAVEVRDGVARLAGAATIAGSTLTLDRAVRVAVQAGVPLNVALAAATIHPAAYLGLDKVGRLAPGCFADLVVLDETLAVTRVMRRGEWVPRRET
ncbi:MAG: amidohydrolase family protein [Actinomycetia bacterium]|nr:amidohydrolase family protein [Actinomycetes bacterium]